MDINTRLSGVLVHTRASHGKLIYMYMYAYYDILQYLHDSNLVIQVIQQSTRLFHTISY